MSVRASSSDVDLFARAALVRKLIIAGQMDPWNGLYYVVCPTDSIRAAESEVSLEAQYRRKRRDV